MEFSTSIRLEDDPVDILSQLITRTIPNKKGNRKYTPLTSRYTASCTRISLNLIQGEADFLRMSEDSCAPISIHLAGPYLADYPTFTVVPRGEGLYGFSTLIKLNPEFSDLESISSSLVIIHKNESCTVMGNAYNAKDSPISGKLFPPEIKAIKCIYSDGTIDVLSTSYIQFGATSPQSFRSDVGLIMKDHSDLVDAMAENMDVINIHGAPVLLAQYKITDNVADILACYTLIPTNERVMCVYQTINLITMDRQDPDAMISKIREGNRTSGFIPSFYTKMQPIIPIIDGVPEQVSILSLKGSTVKLSNYLASLGQNVDLDWKQMYFIVKYDTQDIIDGFEIPAILFYFCCALMAVSLVMWLITNFWIPEYSGSLHNNITRQLSKRSKTKAPFLMMFSEQTKQFDGVPIISRYPTMVDDADTTVNSLTVALNYMEGVPSDVSLMS
ncbi:hypothetical protein BGZ76_005017 [Entomortierella beljakovae]|nr:hypothetical protein BGZ76_005017 [Entomortierella beljakovae]